MLAQPCCALINPFVRMRPAATRSSTPFEGPITQTVGCLCPDGDSMLLGQQNVVGRGAWGPSRTTISTLSTNRVTIPRHEARNTLPPRLLPRRTYHRSESRTCTSCSPIIAAAAAADDTDALGVLAEEEEAPMPRNPLKRLLSFVLPFVLLLGFLLVVLRFPAARSLATALYRRYVVMGAPGARLVLVLLAALVPVHRVLRGLLRPLTLRLGLQRLRKEVQHVLQELEEGRPLTDQELSRLEALQLPATGGRWDGQTLRTRLLQEAAQGVLEVAQGAALGGPGIGSEAASHFLGGLGRALGLSELQAAAVVRGEVAATSRAILAAAERASTLSGVKGGNSGAEALGVEQRRLAAVAAVFPLNDGSTEAIEVAAAVRRVEIWVAAATNR